jgi:DNA-binding PadR family transcriptional regulator
MLSHLILGFLRDGQARHGYELITEYKARSGNQVSAGNFYRELARMAAERLVQTGVNPPDADARRIPYQITEKGRQSFDEWLLSPARDDGDLSAWLLFIDRVPHDTRDRLLDRWQDDLWLKSKALSRSREDAAADPGVQTGYGALPPARLVAVAPPEAGDGRPRVPEGVS